MRSGTKTQRERESVCSRACWCKVVTWVAYKDRLKSISPDRVMGGNLRRISREGEGIEDGIFLSPGRRANREQKFLSGGSMFVSREGGGEREKKRHDSRGDGSCSCRLCDVFFLSFFLPSPTVFFTTKVNVTNGPNARLVRTISSSPKLGFFRPAARRIEIRRMEKLRVETLEENEEDWYGENCYQTGLLVVDPMNFDRDWHRFVISNDLLYNLSIVDLPLKSR